LDSSLRTPITSRVFKSAERPVTIFCTAVASKSRYKALETLGANITVLPADAHGHVDIISTFDYLGNAGMNNIIIEAGTGIASAVYEHGLVDHIFWTQSPHILGEDAVSALGALSLLALPDQNNYIPTKVVMIGNDLLRVFAKPVGAD
jgi:diaminohydroxyphosphoribosylaminopyrimidine deaminase/5-amino-6-(5-phosphoribosylamino)uracil reductase